MVLILLGFSPVQLRRPASLDADDRQPDRRRRRLRRWSRSASSRGGSCTGSIGFFVFPIAIYGACRIGKPGSPWARRRYGERRPKKQAKAEERFPPDRRTERFKNAFRDIVGGKPSEGVAAVSEEALAATREAAEEVRQGVDRITHPGETRDPK